MLGIMPQETQRYSPSWSFFKTKGLKGVEATKQGDNFMTLKYAGMDNPIPSLKEKPQIHEIVDIESKWQTEVSAKHLHLIVLGQTLGYHGPALPDVALQLLYRDICRAPYEGWNLTEKTTLK